MDQFLDVIAGRTKQHTFKHGTLQIVMRTLTEKELDDVYRVIGIEATSELMADVLRRRRILSRALISVNGLPMTSFSEVQEILNKEDKIAANEAVYRMLSSSNPQSIDVMWSCYLALSNQETKAREALKKGLVDSLISAGSSGNSLKKQAL